MGQVTDRSVGLPTTLTAKPPLRLYTGGMGSIHAGELVLCNITALQLRAGVGKLRKIRGIVFASSEAFGTQP